MAKSEKAVLVKLSPDLSDDPLHTMPWSRDQMTIEDYASELVAHHRRKYAAMYDRIERKRQVNAGAR